MDTPRPPSADDSRTVFADVNGRLCSRCIRCGAWTPLAEQTPHTRIRIGRIRRIPNPNFGVPHHPKQFEETIWVPQVRVGAGCQPCQDEYTTLRRRHPDTREPFIRIVEFPTHVTAPK